MADFNKKLRKPLFQSMNAKEIQDPENVLIVCLKGWNCIRSKMKNTTKSSIIGINAGDAIKLDIVKLQYFFIS